MPSTTQYHGAACKTCRRRGKKCTRELPTCESCKERGVECEGYALKWAGLASRGFLAGQDASKIATRRKRKRDRHDASQTAGTQQESEVSQPSVDEQLLARPDDNTASAFAGADISFVWTPSNLQVSEIRVQEEFENDDVFADESALVASQSGVLSAIGVLSEINEASALPLENAEQSFVWPPSHFSAHDYVAGNDDVADDDDLIAGIFEETPFIELPPSLQGALMPAPRPAMNFFEVPSELSFILDYHVREAAAKLCVDNNTYMNPYRQYIYPLALQKPALLYACAAMSSIHYNTRQGNSTSSIEALKLRGKALRRLQESMWSSEGAIDEANLATVMMLILCDMCMGGHSNFETYFTFAKSLMDARGEVRTPNNFVEQYISWLDLMSCASTSRRPVLTLTDSRSLRNSQASWDHDVVPCAADIFDILSEIVTLHKDHDGANVTGELNMLKTRILTSPARTERGLPWLHLTEAYRHGVLLYMQILFELDTDEDETTWLVSSIMHHAKSLPSWSGWSDQLLWPLYHAGLLITDVRRQDWIREKMQEMQSSGGFANVASAMDALELVWSGQFSGRYVDLLVKHGVGDMLVI